MNKKNLLRHYFNLAIKAGASEEYAQVIAKRRANTVCNNDSKPQESQPIELDQESESVEELLQLPRAKSTNKKNTKQ